MPPHSKPFDTPFDIPYIPPITLVELRMSYYSGEIRSRPRWWMKIHEPPIAATWHEEIVEHDRLYKQDEEDGPKWDGVKWRPRDSLTEAQLSYIFDELRYEASKRDPATGIFASSIRKVYESHSLIDTELRERLVKATSIIETDSDDDKDWHSGPGGRCFDLVDPSLYPISIGHGLFCPPNPSAGQEPELMLLDNDRYLEARPDLKDISTFRAYAVSPAYQWLPTDFAVSADGNATALGYINNVHPFRHRALYPAITSRVVARFVPMFERVLIDVLYPPSKPTKNVGDWYKHIEASAPPWEPKDTYYKRRAEWARIHEWLHVPEPEAFAPPSADNPRFEFSLRGRTIQVVIKHTEVRLTPEDSTYPGDVWHVEGMANERIVATALYCYAMENVTVSRIAFRQRVGAGEYGNDLPRGDNKGQPLGHVALGEDKCVAFPNVYQHREEPFELVDKTRPGRRKLLALFLVDPNVRILSPADVPPQQREWTLAEAEKALVVQNLPQEPVDMIVGFAEDGFMTREQAEKHRLKLMEE
ncbi:uncharacterized protein BXZ73DRAFT_75713 [Epithele typhae]|uniref:uncharacterized protein n=1 Tax=Epithele typhae TaxID=378194 RepID=UPI002007D830|nr:uncharacterized protein BXZ73DRAFT_75713 [Epithele typhae]KAH9940099.1 hypothetical protein BXZ73DRAFT_75713 [Epithele typhae]